MSIREALREQELGVGDCAARTGATLAPHRALLRVSALREGVTYRETDDPEPSIWTHTLCGIAVMLIVAGYHIATWRI